LQPSTSTTNARYRITNAGATLDIGIEGSSGGSIVSGSTLYSVVVNQVSAYSMHFGTNNTIKMTINNVGYVGIGTTNPGQSLYIAGSINLQSSGVSKVLISNSSFSYLNGGIVGIGTTNPGSSNFTAESLDVYGAGYINGDLKGILNVTDSASMAANVGGSISFSGRNTTAGNITIFASIQGMKENATDSDSKGALRFVVRPNAFQEAMRISSSSYVGIGTTNPQSILQIQNGKMLIQQVASNAIVEGIRLTACGVSDTASSGNSIVWFSPNNPNNAINAGRIIGLFDGQNGWNDCRISIQSAVDYGVFADTLSVKGNRVGIGTTNYTSTAKFEVSGLGYAYTAAFVSTTYSGISIKAGPNPGDTNQYLILGQDGGGTTRFLVCTNGLIQSNYLAGSGNRAVYSDASGNLTNSSSDIILKENVLTLTNCLSKSLLLRPVSYNWIDKEKRGSQNEIGLIAQEVQAIIPEVIGANSDGTLALDYAKLTAILIGALKEQNVIIESLNARLQILENK